jgi:molybdate transport system substrate-binding protein
MGRDLFVLSAGAAKAVVQTVQPAFETRADALVHATFGAVGAMRDKWKDGAPCDVLILSTSLLDQLAEDGAVVPATRVSLGRVGTGIAVPAGASPPSIGDAAQLAATLGAASALYLPDPERATAGIHCVDVLRRLGLLDPMRARLRAYPNGAAAMAALAAAGDVQALGCTQVTEILYTPGVILAGLLPAGFGLVTEYAGAVTARALVPQLARDFVALLGSDATRAARKAGGFEV